MKLVGEIHQNSKKKVVGLVAASCVYVVGKLCLRCLWTDSDEHTSNFLTNVISTFFIQIFCENDLFWVIYTFQNK